MTELGRGGEHCATPAGARAEPSTEPDPGFAANVPATRSMLRLRRMREHADPRASAGHGPTLHPSMEVAR